MGVPRSETTAQGSGALALELGCEGGTRRGEGRGRLHRLAYDVLIRMNGMKLTKPWPGIPSL